MLEKMKSMIAQQLGLDENTITPDTSFKEDLGADSLDLFELVMNLEEEYAIEIPSEELADLNKVGDVIDYLKKHGIEE
ncbi:MAG: acyl carrier protein [Lachnospiraceae bacterium]|nr:acyl carrier protein [Lachnospiraceae bacterium]